MIIVIN